MTDAHAIHRTHECAPHRALHGPFQDAPHAMPQVSAQLAVVFSDIVGSSQLYTTLGNARAKQKIDTAISTMSEIVKTFGGEVIKTIGDEIMFCHNGPEAACQIAVEMNLALNKQHFYLRTGIAFGPVIRDRNDLYGDTVNNSAFLAKTAIASQILLDPGCFQNLGLVKQQCDFFDRLALKGHATQSEVYRLNWEANNTMAMDATVVTDAAIKPNGQASRSLVVDYEGERYEVNQIDKLCIGRDQGKVAIFVRHRNASRNHCSLMFHRGKFILQDHSTNGTYVAQQGQEEVFLKREATTLLENGKISIGQPCENSEAILRYQIY